MRSKFENDPRITAALGAVPEEDRLEALNDAVNTCNGYTPASLDEGMGRHPTNEEVRDFIATEGHHPRTLPDIILGGSDRALVREVDRSGYFKLVYEQGSWLCGCGAHGCIHKAALKANLKARGRR